MRRMILRRCLWSGVSVRGLAVDAKYVRVIDDSAKMTRRLVMCNEKQRNALGLDMIRALQEGVSSVEPAKHRVLVISSAQASVFSAGHDLKELTTERGRQVHEKVFQEFTRLCLSLRDLPVPTIAEVYGLAAAAGCQLAVSCDLIVASEHAAFSTPGVKFGVFCSTPGVPLVRNLSPKLSAKMLLTGAPMPAREAFVHGLVSELVDPCPDQRALEDRVGALVAQIVSNSRSVLALGKSCFYKQLEQGSDLDAAYRVASGAMLDNLTYADTQSGLKAFAQKKKPMWSHSDEKLSVN